MAVKVKVQTAAGETEYTVTSVAPTQPTSGSLAVDVANPKLTVSGLTGPARIAYWLSSDGSDPTAEDADDKKLKNGKRILNASVGDKLIIKGLNIPS